MNKIVFVLGLLMSSTLLAQVSYNGNGNSGFGGPLGGGSFSISHTGTTVTVTMTRGGGNFNDYMVMYIANGSTGRSVIGTGVRDFNDAHRRAISNVGSGNLTFPAGFEATHAIAINTGFGGLWSIPSTGSIGNGGLSFVSSVGNPSSASFTTFNFSFDWTSIGLTSSDQFKFVATYGNPNDGGNTVMFSSNEAIGGGITGGNPGSGAMTYTTYFQYPSGLRGGTAASNAAGDWTTIGTWVNGNAPLSTDAVQINHNVSVNTTNAAASSLVISTGNTLTINANQSLSVTGGVTGAGNLAVNGIFRLNAGGFTSITPTYGSASQLTYNTGGSYNTSNEWPGTSSPASIRIINSAVVLTGSRNVTGILLIESGGSLDVNGHTLSLKASSESVYSQLLNQGTLTGNITFERAISGSTAGWRFFSPATSGTQNSLGTGLTLNQGGPANVINLSSSNPNGWQGVGGSTATALVPGRGYALYFGAAGVNGSATSGTISTTGSVQASNVTVSGLSDGNSGSSFGWTLVGNPFSAGLTFDNVANTRTNLDNAYYIWNPTANSGNGAYASFVSGTSSPSGALNGVIPPGQGFLVKANAASPVLTFGTAARTTGTPNNQLRTGSSFTDRLYVRVTNTQNTFYDEAAILSMQGASSNFESERDAFKLNSFHPDAVNVSSRSADGQRLSINVIDEINATTEVPLTLECTESSLMTLDVNVQELNPDLHVVLHDRYLNRNYNMRTGPYTFAHVPAETNRFVLRFMARATPTSINQLDQADHHMFVSGDKLFVRGSEGLFSVTCTDMLGRQVFVLSNQEAGEFLLPSLVPGTYVLRLQDAKGVQILKINR